MMQRLRAPARHRERRGPGRAHRRMAGGALSGRPLAWCGRRSRRAGATASRVMIGSWSTTCATSSSRTSTPDSASFLSRTAILGELSGDLCDAVLERDGSAVMLRELARSNALVTPLDSKDQTFRYHALLREMLSSELHRCIRARRPSLHARAAQWHAARGDYDRAVPHAIATGDVETAAAMIWSQAAHYASFGRDATLERWLEPLHGSRDRRLGASLPGPSHLSLAAGQRRRGRALDGSRDRPGRRTSEATRPSRSGWRPTRSRPRGRSRRRRRDGQRCGARLRVAAGEDPWRSLCRLHRGCLVPPHRRARSLPEPRSRTARAAARSAVPTVHDALPRAARAARDRRGRPRRGDAAEPRVDRARRAPRSLRISRPRRSSAAVAGLRRGAQRRRRDRESTTSSRRWPARRPAEISPWYQAETRIVIARTLALLDDIAGARAQLAGAGRDLRQTPDAHAADASGCRRRGRRPTPRRPAAAGR